MRKLVALFTASSLLISAPLTASAAVKAGGACTKLNSTTTVGGYKFTCIKSGKKLVWSKGVKVVVAKPMPMHLYEAPTLTQGSKIKSSLNDALNMASLKKFS